MSAFNVGHGGIDAALVFLKTKGKGPSLGGTKANRLGQAMLRLNEASLEARYGDAVSDESDPDGWASYEWEAPDAEHYTDAAGFKALSCWRYQTCEGDIPETSQLYQRVSALLDQHEALSNTPEYDAAAWGGPSRGGNNQ